MHPVTSFSALPVGEPVDLFVARTGMTPRQASERHAAVVALHPYIGETMGVELGRVPDSALSWGVALHLVNGKHNAAEVAPLAAALLRFAAEFTVDNGLTASPTNYQTAWTEHANGCWPVSVAVHQADGRPAGGYLIGYTDADRAALFFKPYGAGFPPMAVVTTRTLQHVLEVLFAEARGRDELRTATR